MPHHDFTAAIPKNHNSQVPATPTNYNSQTPFTLRNYNSQAPSVARPLSTLFGSSRSPEPFKTSEAASDVFAELDLDRVPAYSFEVPDGFSPSFDNDVKPELPQLLNVLSQLDTGFLVHRDAERDSGLSGAQDNDLWPTSGFEGQPLQSGLAQYDVPAWGDDSSEADAEHATDDFFAPGDYLFTPGDEFISPSLDEVVRIFAPKISDAAEWDDARRPEDLEEDSAHSTYAESWPGREMLDIEEERPASDALFSQSVDISQLHHSDQSTSPPQPPWSGPPSLGGQNLCAGRILFSGGYKKVDSLTPGSTPALKSHCGFASKHLPQWATTCAKDQEEQPPVQRSMAETCASSSSREVLEQRGPISHEILNARTLRTSWKCCHGDGCEYISNSFFHVKQHILTRSGVRTGCLGCFRRFPKVPSLKRHVTKCQKNPALQDSPCATQNPSWKDRSAWTDEHFLEHATFLEGGGLERNVFQPIIVKWI